MAATAKVIAEVGIEDAPLAEVTPDVTPVTAPPTKSVKAKFCFQLADGEKGCHRLPRHKGDHRTTLHRPKVAKVAAVKATPKGKVKPARKLSVAKRREAFQALGARVEAGELTASEALSLAAKLS